VAVQSFKTDEHYEKTIHDRIHDVLEKDHCAEADILQANRV
jgi:hypothetical protein